MNLIDPNDREESIAQSRRLRITDSSLRSTFAPSTTTRRLQRLDSMDPILHRASETAGSTECEWKRGEPTLFPSDRFGFRATQTSTYQPWPVEDRSPPADLTLGGLLMEVGDG